MTDLEQSFEDALDAAEEAKGIREKVMLRGKEVDALFYEWGEDDNPVLGGDSDNGIYKVAIRNSYVPEGGLKPLDEVKARGLTKEFFSASQIGSCTLLTLGESAGEIDD